MKKILGIIILSFLFSGSAFAKIVHLENCYNDNNKDIKFFQANLDKGSWKVRAKKGMTFVSTSGQISSEYTSSSNEIRQGKGVISSTNLNFYNLLKKKFRRDEMKQLVGFYEVDIPKKRVSVFLNLVDADKKLTANQVKVVQKTLGISSNTWNKYEYYIFDYDCRDYWVSGFEAPKKIESVTTGANNKLLESKKICEDLGFKANTEKFADCTLKMMSMQFESTNKTASTSGGTTQEIIVKHKQDYDVWDALLDVSNILLSDGNNSSSSSSNSNTRCVIGKTNPMFGTTTMNCN